MKTTFILFVIALTSISTLAQTPSFEWAKRMGDGNYQYGYDIVNDNSNNILVTGYFQGTVDFDPGAGTSNLISAGGYDVFVQKLDANGNFLWAKSIGNTGGDRGFGITVDDAGSVYITGKFNGTVDFDPNAGTFNLTATGDDAFVLKLDGSGNFIWATQISGTGNEEGTGIAVDGNENVYTTGLFQGTADFDPSGGTFNLTSSGNDDIFIQKLDLNGNLLWAKSMGSTGADRGYEINYDGTNAIYTTGVFMNIVDFDPNAGTANVASNGGLDIFIQKLDINGNFQWAGNMGSTGHDYGYGITTDASGNVISTGYFQGTADFDPGAGTVNLVSNGSTELFIQKLDANGNLLWAEGVGGTSAEVGNYVTTDPAGNIYTTGFFYGSVDFDPGAGVNNLSSLGLADAFVLKLDGNGNHSWATQFGGPGYNEGRSVSIGTDGAVYSTGQFQQTVDFDHTAGVFDLTVAGNNDIYVHKMGQCTPSTSTDVVTACNTYTWIDGITYTSTTNTPTFTLTNMAGCDSIVTLDLTVNYSNTGTDVQNACNSYTWIDGMTYTSSTNIPTFTLTNMAGCDSVVTLDLTVNYSNSGTDVVTACDSYTWIDGITYTSSTNVPTFTLTNEAGCDSVVTLDLTVNYSNTGADVISACDSYTWIDGITYTSSTNVPTFTLTNAAGCDSVVTLDLTVNYSNTGTDVVSACDALTWIDGITYTSSTNAPTFTLTNVNGCDSIVTLDLTINNSTAGTDIVTACDSYTWIDGNTYTSSTNTPTHTLTNAVGCDSIVTLDLTVNYSTAGTDVVTACDSYTWIDGIMYTSSTNTPTFVLTNAAGCDSIVTLNLMINYTNTGTDVVTACDSYTWIDGITYTSSTNVPTHVLTNVAGCDSIVTLDLTINNSNSGTDVVTACDSYTWIDGITYTSSTNTPTFTVTNSAGCDSLVTLDLTVNYSSAGTDVITACNSYTWINGNTYTSSTNIPSWTLTNASGCDSVVTLDLTINTVDVSTTNTSPTLSSNLAGASYQWIDCDNANTIIPGETGQSFTATSNGNYAVIIDDGTCTDTSDCMSVNNVSVKDIETMQVDVFPNPSAGIFNVALPNGSYKLSVMDLNGNILLVNNTTEQSTLINLSNFEKAVYFLKIEGVSGSVVKRLILN